MSHDEPTFRTRRAFLQTAAIASAGLVVPSFLSRTAQLASAEPDRSRAQSRQPIPGFRDDHVLVVVQLGGGNDGLNTVVPYRHDAYRRARNVLRLDRNRVLPLTDELALNDSLAPLKGLFDDGLLAVVNGVGYPNPNRSHFRSMEIWHTASDADQYLHDGWIGRYFNNACSGEARPQAGVAIGGEAPQAFGGTRSVGVAFEQPEQFAWQPGHATGSDMAFRALHQLDRRHRNGGARTVDFLRHVSTNIVLASDEVRDATERGRPASNYPANNRLARSLRHVSRLIQGELGTRIYFVNQGGYDTHANQTGTHDMLLQQLGEALSAFHADLKQSGHSRRVLIMCFSEFGRRVTENASRGTDHGTAGPMLLLGDSIRPGLHGSYPNMDALERDDLRHTTDFRSVYASVLKQWFDIDPEPVLGHSFPQIDLIRA